MRLPLSPKVSVLCLTYNQAKYVRQMLDSLLAQETDFPVEILINDDHSSDGTVEILQEYAAKHGNIKLNLQKENLYSQGVRGMLGRFLLPKAKGKYVALCEGDDYWTDPKKLQTQIDFMDARPDYSVCFHPVIVRFENGDEKDSIFPAEADESAFTLERLLKENFIQTNSVVYRRRKSYSDLPQGVLPGDWFLHLYHAKFGKIGFINRTMAVYRRHPGGLWWDSYKDQDKFWSVNGLNILNFFIKLSKVYSDQPKYADNIEGSIGFAFNKLMKMEKEGGSHLFQQALDQYPDYARRIFTPPDKPEAGAI